MAPTKPPQRTPYRDPKRALVAMLRPDDRKAEQAQPTVDKWTDACLRLGVLALDLFGPGPDRERLLFDLAQLRSAGETVATLDVTLGGSLGRPPELPDLDPSGIGPAEVLEPNN